MRRARWFVILVLGLELALLGGRIAFGSPGATGGGRAIVEANGVRAASAPAQGTPTPTPSATPPPACGLFWRLVPSANPGSYNILYAVAAVATNDVWAVDFYLAGSAGQTLIEHWDGSQWSVVPSPNVGSTYNFLQSIAVVAANDIWAVGTYTNSGSSQTLIEHWNGSTWSVVPSPNQGTGSNQLSGVAVVAANDIWAVGDSVNGGVHQTLAEHWNGSAWSVVPSPNQGGGANYLYAATAVAPDNVWAVGAAGTQTLIEHWNGSAWTVVAGPNVGTSANIFHSVTAVAANDIWAVGSYANGGFMQTLVAQWNGGSWSVMPSANGPPGDSDLRGVAAVGANDIWVVGYTGAGAVNWVPYSEHWNGTTWSSVPIPNGGLTHNATLWGVAAISTNDIWTVGDNSTTMTEHYGDPCVGATTTVTSTAGPPAGTPTPPLPTQTPGGPSATAGPSGTPTQQPTGTPGPSLTPCSVNFSDVRPADYFYTPVQYLYCHGVISGYGDGTFRPYNDTTRSQMIKIVVLGFNKPIRTPAGGAYTFEDVPPSHPFWAYIETAAAGAIVSGYTCGTLPAGPCIGPTNRPYFLPYNAVTRGQLSKIAVVAAGWVLQNPPNNSFEDVPPGSPFYVFVETASCHKVVSGYTCGAPPAGACVPPGSRPYFLPYNNATRGQIAKIVYNAILSGPGCSGP